MRSPPRRGESMDPNTVAAAAASASALIAAGAFITAIVQLRYLGRRIAGDHDWKRREKAFQYSQVHHPGVKEARERLAPHFRSLPTHAPVSAFNAAANADPTIDADL